MIWQQQVLGGFQAIWSWRQRVGDDLEPWTEAAAASAARSFMLQAIRKAYTRAPAPAANESRAIVHRLLQKVARERPERPLPTAGPVARYVLFFDGGSRGNPGPGGAGAVIVQVDSFGSNARIVWSAAMSLAAKTTTNNHAEYAGLVHGLTAARTRQWRPVEVVSDSQLIITQMRESRAPRNPRLRRLYGQARLLSSSLGVVQWRHHVRGFNKMVHAAANVAMDRRSSLQTFHPTNRPEWRDLHLHLSNDITRWRVSTHPGSAGLG